MKRTHKRLTRLLSAGVSLALLTTLLPGALAADVRVDDAEIRYTTDSDEVVHFERDDFLDECLEYANEDTLEYIYFTDLPDNDEGTLYSSYSSSRNRSEVSTRTRYTASDLDDMAFVPEEDFGGTVVIPIEGTAYYDRTTYSFEGEVRIVVNRVTSSSSSSDNLTYSINTNGTLTLNYRDFDAYFDENVEAIQFTGLPNSSAGTLYHRYNSSSQSAVSRSTVYSYSDINNITFVAARSYSGTVSIPFVAALSSSSTRTYNGTLTIRVGNSSSSAVTGDVTLYTDVNREVYLESGDFDDYAYDKTSRGEQAAYLWFTSLPSSRDGTLYYEGSRSDTAVSVNEEFRHSEIDYLFFEPDDDFEGSVTIPFAGEADSGESFRGDLVINVGVSGDAEVVVKLQGATGNPITFDADDFNDAVVDETGSNLNYVVFDYTSGRGGYLYFDYGGGSEDEVDDARYYRSSSPSLDDVTFVPGSAAGTTTRIPFRGYTTNNKTVSGEVEITYVTLSSPSVITYTSNGLGVDFRASDFSAACAARGGSSLVSVTFPNPSLTGGQLYYSFTSPTKYRGEVISSVTYDVSGIYRLDGITFLPKAEYTGSVVIPYVGTDAAGITYNGNIQIMVTPPSTTTRFNDMGSYGWAVPGVEFLAAYGITTGTGTGTTYSPAGTLTRGDYILMLVRTFGFTADGAASGNFSDVKADAYYADALAVARALGIATADANGNFRPGDPVTRQDSMVFLYRAMQKANRTIPSAYDSYLTRFPDGASVATDARPAMAAMAQAGVIKGDQAGNLNPTGTLTRAEMAVILHRALTL